MTTADEAQSTFFFPLRTNVGFFDAPKEYLPLEDRVKQACLLYDRIVFESGVYEATASSNGSYDFWTPPDDVDDDLLTFLSRDFSPIGGQAVFGIQLEGSEPVTLLSGPVERRFFCQFHTIFNTLSAYQLPWIEFEAFQLTDYGQELAKHIERMLKQDFAAALPDTGQFLRNRILGNYCRDLVVSQELGAAASMHGLYAPLLAQKAHVSTAPGFAALQVTLPDLRHRHWEEILEVREEDCFVEFREKFVSIETAVQFALTNEMVSDLQYQIALLYAFNAELLKELENSRPKIGEIASNVVLDAIMSPIPGLSTAMTAYMGGVELLKTRKSWLHAFFKLKKRDID
jgi:hypothetical protein